MGDIFGRYGAAAASSGRAAADINGLPPGAVVDAGPGASADLLDPMAITRQQVHAATLHHAATALGQLAMLYYLHKQAGGQHSPEFMARMQGAGMGDELGTSEGVTPGMGGFQQGAPMMAQVGPRPSPYYSPLVERVAQMNAMFGGNGMV